ncbi:hypothetical protein A2853_00035 [Candidatus Kaiserbacteria bacterium RIFCSPHIGHO2_01_FULL_55_17]|uniref:Uncharacterized protein n=1 Tax=Candidatus Kaiserbacteria bacterium RIFCSPHIGHO2_01_FULL_55_17 TaxID=1798484 RepID=A0A1F6DAD2_9BACT|nr:MAG: hypothetical protein A2853_00035 [Candidatus Kaiserbacteria bacterium RIFCSPHIGHO2_01_FULL_55_17]
MSRTWFKRVWGGWCEVPISWEGWIVTLLLLGANLWYFERVDNASHSVSDTLIGWAPFFIVSAVLLTVVARFTSR